MSSFVDFPVSERVGLVKKEFIAVIRRVFDKPQELKAMIASGKLTNDQGKQILTKLVELNTNSDCVCCRKFDQRKLPLQPIDQVFEPLLDVAIEIAKTKSY